MVNLDAGTANLFNSVKEDVSVGAFAALCIKAHLEFLKGKMNDKENQPIRANKVHT